jgi:hypothetical protein
VRVGFRLTTMLMTVHAGLGHSGVAAPWGLGAGAVDGRRPAGLTPLGPWCAS